MSKGHAASTGTFLSSRGVRGDDGTCACRSRPIRERERLRFGREWSVEELALGLVGDVGDLAKLIQAREGVRDVGVDVQKRLGHELSDVLWSAMVIAAECGIDLEASDAATMDEIEAGL